MVGEHALGHIDLTLTIAEVHINTTRYILAVGGWEKDVANLLTLAEGSVAHVLVLRVIGVSQRNQEFAARESVKVGTRVALNPLFVPNLRFLSLSIDLGNNLIQVTVSVHVVPERFTVRWVVSTAVVLLGTVVNEWDTSGGEREDGRGGELLVLALMVVQETSVVVVVNEDSESVNVVEVIFFSVVARLNLAHVLSTSEHVANRVVHGVVEQTSKIVLVRSHVSGVSIEALSHLEDTGGFSILAPEIALDLGNGIDTDTVEVVLLNDALNPVLEVLTHIGVVLVKIGEVSKTAVLNIACIVPVSDLAVAVVVL